MQGPHCTWFARSVPCSKYQRLAVIAGVFALAELALMNAVALSGGTGLLFDSTGRWCVSHRINHCSLSRPAFAPPGCAAPHASSFHNYEAAIQAVRSWGYVALLTLGG